MHEKLKTEDFNAGTPYSCWLREEVGFEINTNKNGLLNKYRKYEKYFPDWAEIAMEVRCLNDYNPITRSFVVDLIRAELDPTFDL